MIDLGKFAVYQIYPRSFADSNGDGVGDIPGVIDKLDYLENLGVNCLWLTPFYPSPQKDNGYDVADYKKIDPLYGTFEDFDKLVALCKEKNMFLMLDMVFNHTSDQHPWFKKALSGDEKYRNYYIFKKSETGVPTNWVSKFGGSAWEKVGNTDEYYLHLFDASQPDLNWENPELREEIYQIMDFWLEKGIRGFRFDVINLISKPEVYENDHEGDGRRFYTDGPNVHQYLKELNRRTFGKYPTVTVGEMSSTSIENCIKYSNPVEKELDMVFNFHHLKVDYEKGNKWTRGAMDFEALKNLLHTWQTELQEGGGHQAMFWCNHDQPRIVSRFGDDGEYHKESSKMLATALHLMWGTPYIYQGEEIGMTNAYFEKIEDYRDVESANYYRILKEQNIEEKEILEILSKKSRDNSRTPMQWDSRLNCGFSVGKPWIPLGKNSHITAEAALADKTSIFYHYQKLIRLRKTEDIIVYGKYSPLFEDNPSAFAYKRECENETLIVICNFFKEDTAVDLKDMKNFVQKGELLISNYDYPQINESQVKLRPYEGFCIRTRIQKI